MMDTPPKRWVTLLGWIGFGLILFALVLIVRHPRAETVLPAPAETSYRTPDQWTSPKPDLFETRLKELERQIQELKDQRESDRMRDELDRLLERSRIENEQELDKLMERRRK